MNTQQASQGFHHYIPVTVLTGFLGSGKTTLLSSLLRHPELSDTAVIINEFGEVGLDHFLIERSDESVIELQNGCICCTIRGDLKKTLKELLEKMLKGEIPIFSRVIVETTGLADPVPIVHTLMASTELFGLYHLENVITVVDALNGEATLDVHPEALKQAAMAERILVSKSDVSPFCTQSNLYKRLRDINPGTEIIPVSHGKVDIDKIFGMGGYNHDRQSAWC